MAKKPDILYGLPSGDLAGQGGGGGQADVLGAGGAFETRRLMLEESMAARRALSRRGLGRADVQAAAAARSRTDVGGVARSGAKDSIEPMRGVRRAMAQNMASAHEQVVPATLSDVADINGWAANQEVTLRLIPPWMPTSAVAISQAIRSVPQSLQLIRLISPPAQPSSSTTSPRMTSLMRLNPVVRSM